MLNEKIIENMELHTIIKTGTTDNGWTYRLYNDKWIEAWCFASISPSVYNVNIDTPFPMQTKTYHVSVTPAHNWATNNMFGCDETTRSYTHFNIARSSAPASTSDFDIFMAGQIQ